MFRGFLQLSLIVVACSLCIGNCSKDVACGSAVYVEHVESDTKLFSASINWGTGSGQQAVTAFATENDRSLLWYVKEGDGQKTCQTGLPIKCGDVIRLEHLGSQKNVHSHLVRSPLSGGKEVSVFGESGKGDTGDNWTVVCLDKKETIWKRNDKVAFKHIDIGGFLHTSKKNKFTSSNCPRCPILGHQEVAVVVSGSPGKDDYWRAREGIMITASDDEDDDLLDLKDEL